jgi:hypothetical protein
VKVPRALWLVAPLLVGAGLLLFVLRGGLGPGVPAAAPLGPLPTSSLTVGVAYALDGLAGELEDGIPTRIGDLGSRLRYPADERLQYAFEAERGALELSSAGDTIRIATELEYGGQVWYATPMGIELTTSCGIEAGGLAASAPRAGVRMSFPLVVDEDWAVRSVPSIDRVEPVSENDRCRAVVLGFEVDATDAIMASLRAWLEEEAARVGARVESVSPRPYAEEWWATAQAPIELASGVWLVLDPEALRYRIGGAPDQPAAGPEAAGVDPGAGSIMGEIGATVRPRVVIGPRPTTSLRDLPPLEIALSPATDSTTPPLTVEVVIGFDEASEILGAELEGAAWQLMGRDVRVASAELSGVDAGRVALSLEIVGDVPARVRLVGTPVLDSVADEITLPDLDVTVEEGATLPRLLVWVHRFFPGILRSRARFPLDGVIPAELDEGMELRLSDDATLEASLSEIELSEVSATDSAIVVRGRARPDATLRVDPRR